MTVMMQRAQFDVGDFVLDFPRPPELMDGVTVVGEFVDMNPSLATLRGEGISQALAILEPCGVNPPHVHPGSDELALVMEGGPITSGFIEENNGRILMVDVKKGESCFQPQGLMNFQFNDNCEEATFVASFRERDPGVTTIASNFFKFVPPGVLRAALGLNDDEIHKLQQSVDGAKNVDPVCAKRCKLEGYY